jgi:ADP-ribose pyrophosphatase
VTTRTIQRERLLEGRIFAVDRCGWTAGDGTNVVREVVRHPGAVTIVPVRDDGRIVLVRNWRIAVGGPLWELPAGKREPNEDPADTASRELREETGYAAGAMTPLGSYYTSPGFADELMHAFEATSLTAGTPAPEAGEELEVGLFECGELDDLARRGAFRDGKSLAALHLWRLHRGVA